MGKSIELRNQKADVVSKMRAFLDKVEEEKRELTAEEESQYSGWEKSLDDFDKKIARAEKLENEERAQKEIIKAAPKETGVVIIGEGKDGDFRNFGEFIYAVRFEPLDNRLRELRLQQIKNGTSGGYMVPEQFKAELLQVTPQSAVIRPRARVLPAGDPPDAALTIPALDQGSSQNMYGGVTVYHQGESDSITESSANFKKITLQPRKMTAYMTSSNELLVNWTAAGSLIPTLMRSAMIGAEDTDFLSGDGVNKALGVLNANAAINYNRATASQISYADVVGMYARIRMGLSPVWVASQTCIPQLANIRDTGNNNLWIQSAVAGVPPTLMGIPVVFSERSPALGTRGDLMLCDFSYYLIKDGSGPAVAVSEHFRFQNDETAFRLTWHVDGQSWLNEAIPLEGSTTNTVSPFVILDTP